jgi:hypothetical protein
VAEGVSALARPALAVLLAGAALTLHPARAIPAGVGAAGRGARRSPRSRSPRVPAVHEGARGQW